MVCAGFRRKIGLIRRAAPEVIAGIDRLHLRQRDGRARWNGTRHKHEQIGTLTPAVGETDPNTAAVLLDALEDMPEMIALTIDRLYQQLPQSVPGRDDLKHWPLGDHVASRSSVTRL